MKQLLSQVFMFATIPIVGLGIWGLCRLLRCKPVDPGIPNPRRSSLYALVSVGCSMAILILFMLVQRSMHAGAPHGPTGHNNGGLNTELSHLFSQLVVLVVYCIPAGLFMFKNKEPLRSVGITKVNLWGSVLIGLILSTLLFLVFPGSIGKLKLIGLSHGIALVSYAFVGFGEEFLFRGFLQIRLVAWLGKWPGWVLASALMAFAHLPSRFLVEGQGLSGALISCSTDIPGSLLFGFIMLCTGNIAAGGIFHTFANWVNTLK